MSKSTFLYVLFHATEPVFKIGTAVDVLARAKQLPDEIDMQRSRVVEFPEGPYALKLERLFHTFLDTHNKPRPHGGDGYTEWYDKSAFEDLRTFLQQSRSLLRCSELKALPVKAPRPTKAVPADFEQKQREREMRRAELFQSDQKMIVRTHDWLKAAKEDGGLIGWFGKRLVLWLDNWSEDRRESMLTILTTPIWHIPDKFMVASARQFGDLYLLEFCIEPANLVKRFAPFNLDVWDIQQLLVNTPLVPTACLSDLELLTQLGFFELLDADERVREERAALHDKAASRILAEVIEDRKPVPQFFQRTLELSEGC